MSFRSLLPLAVVCGLAAAACAQEKPTAFTGAHIIPIDGAPIPHGVLLVQHGKIVAVGDAATVRLSSDVQVIDVTGKVIMPGLVDSHSHIGGGQGADNSAPIQPDVRVLDAIDARSASIQKAQAGGITTVNVMPGSGHLISGQTLYLKLRDGRIIDDVLIKLDDGSIAGGLKMANGTNPLKSAPGFPGTRAKSAALVREQYLKARDYQAKLARANGDPEKLPARDLALEMLIEVMEGRRIVQHHSHRYDDILTVLRLAREFGFKVVLHHVSDAWKVADEIAAAGAACSVILVDSPGGKLETKDVNFATPGVLEKAGVLVGLHTDDGVTDSRHFLRMAGFAVRAGMTRDGALRGVTLANAQMLGLDHRVGSLTPGKDADFILLNGDPLSVYTQVEQTWVEGQKVFDLTNPQDRLYALGGDGAGEPNRTQLCCYSNAWDLIAAVNAQLFGGAQ